MYASRYFVLSLIALCSLGVLSSWAQTTIHVPADQSTIQSGIDAAASGDTVLVAPGTYSEGINFKGKAITVTSSGGAAQTIIEASQVYVGVLFNSGETQSAVLNGFTIQNAGNNLFPNTSSDSMDGIQIVDSNPTITNNVITHNHGYGIEIDFGSAIIQGNTISYTTTQYDPSQDFGCDYDDGSGIQVGGNAGISTVISNNTIEHNKAQCDGGGIRLWAAAGIPNVTNNIIRYNLAYEGSGGAIAMFNGSQIYIVQNLIYGNIASQTGGGIYFNGNPLNPLNILLISNTLVGNGINTTTPGTAISVGTQIEFDGGQASFFNNLIISGDAFPAIGCNPDFQYLSSGPPIMQNEDVFNYSGPTFGGYCSDPAGTGGNISTDPKFVSAQSQPFHLQSGSAAIGTGAISAPDLPITDLNGIPRIQNGMVDMGVYEGGVSGGSNSPQKDFSLAATQSTLTVLPQQTGSVSLTIAPSGGFIGTISLAYSNTLPANALSSFQPVTVLAVPGDNSILSTSFTVTNAAPVAQSTPLPGLLGLAGLVSIGGLLIVCECRGHEYRSCSALRLILCCMLATALLTATSCSGGNGSGNGGSGSTSGDSSTFAVVITATGAGNASVTKTVTVNVTVPLQ